MGLLANLKLVLFIHIFLFNGVTFGDCNELFKSIKFSENKISSFEDLSNDRKILARELVEKEELFHSPKLYEFLGQSKEYFLMLLTRWYGKKKDLLKAFDEIPWPYSTLLLDPGIANRSKEFTIFAKKILKRYSSNISIIEVRSEFSDSLGSIKLTRGLWLSSKQKAEQIMNTKGMSPSGYVTTSRRDLIKEMDTILRAVPSEDSDLTLLDLLYERVFGNQFGGTFFQSLSEFRFRNIAIVGGGDWGRNIWTKEDDKFYLFIIELPALDVYYHNDPILDKSGVRSLGNLRFGNYEDDSISRFKRGMEVFTTINIPPSLITGYEVISSISASSGAYLLLQGN